MRKYVFLTAFWNLLGTSGSRGNRVDSVNPTATIFKLWKTHSSGRNGKRAEESLTKSRLWGRTNPAKRWARQNSQRRPSITSLSPHTRRQVQHYWPKVSTYKGSSAKATATRSIQEGHCLQLARLSRTSRPHTSCWTASQSPWQPEGKIRKHHHPSHKTRMFPIQHSGFFYIFWQKRPETNLWSLWERMWVEPRSSNSSAKPTNPSAMQ